ncbi:hypothetical protein BYT27DRAFT_7077196 [Phlegmacium glaucopus]|nr:hypothetical protein BYT27DRAFT_7077196 [Phlegmacium glaucopus]
MPLSTNSHLSSRKSLIYFFTISIFLGGLLSLNTSSKFNVAEGLSKASIVITASQNLDNIEFSWDKLPPRKELIWQECSPGRQCARLIVPLNYSDPEGEEAVIAVIRKPSTLPETSSNYRGPVLFNPGGPGASGIDMIQGPSGDLFGVLLGPQFDIVGFDPRGIGHSTPRVSIFRTAEERAIWESRSLYNTDDAVDHTWARARVRSQLAGERNHIHLRHINSDQTARDMLRIVEAHGRTKIQYWGFSYGSILGATFASMFPDKIERFIIDAVADSENYYATLWSNNLIDTDKAMESFYTGCADAGPDKCLFWAPSPDDIRQNLTNLYKSVQSQPVPVKSDRSYGVVDYNMLHYLVFRSLYTPFASFQRLARGLAELAAGDGTAVLEWTDPPPFECSQDSSKFLEKNSIEASTAIMCNDGVDIPGDLQYAQKHFEMMSKKSEFGKIWSAIVTNCAGWPKFPKDHFQGPFVANTSYPMLVIGNTADPVTPLWAAKKMSRGFNNSVVLTQNSAGHTSVSSPSLCTVKHVRQYFTDGKLPEPGTVCEVDAGPFDKEEGLEEGTAQGRLTMHMSEEDKLIFNALKELSRLGLPFMHVV